MAAMPTTSAAVSSAGTVAANVSNHSLENMSSIARPIRLAPYPLDGAVDSAARPGPWW